MDGATISVALIFSLIAVASQLYSVLNNHKKNQEEEKRKALEVEKNFIKLDVKLDNVIGSTQSILEKQDQNTAKIEDVSREIVKANEQIKSLFKSRDNHEDRISHLEEKK